MKEVFEKIIEKLEECEDIMLSPKDYDCFGEECKYNDCMVCAFAKAIEIVKQEAEQYKGGWIPVSEKLPEEAFGCLVTVIDFNPVTQNEFENILPYVVGYDGNGWNDIDGETIPFEVIAWMPRPEPYKEGERHE